jgi:hypothetical protein
VGAACDDDPLDRDGTGRDTPDDRLAEPTPPLDRAGGLMRVGAVLRGTAREDDAGGFDVDVRGTACPRIVDERSDGRVAIPLLVRA